ncbi:MAG: Ig-like domain-containing protein [Gemmatimonadetes bacterium]|nr:Ig-like domain-containing protein [Gemmatimonadota bacterium]
MRKLWPLMLLVFTSACLSDTSPNPTGTSSSGATLTVTPPTSTLVVGQSVQYAATLSSGSSSATVAWTVSNPAVATVSSTGLVTAKSAGTATLTAWVGSLTKDLAITVANGAADQVTVCDRSQSGCASSAVVQLNSTAVEVRATAFNAYGADITSSCVFQWTPLVQNLVSVQTSSDASKRDALITRVGTGSVSVIVTCGSAIGVFTVN